VTGVFLLIAVGSFLLEKAGLHAHMILLPAPPVSIEPGRDWPWAVLSFRRPLLDSIRDHPCTMWRGASK
jgi:hypothetical protein